MKARPFTVFILIVGLALLLTWSAAAQGPAPSDRELPGRGPIQHPSGRGIEVGDKPFPRPPSLSGPLGTQDMSAAVTLGQPGTVYRYVQTFGVSGEPYPADGTHLNGPNGMFIDSSDSLYVAEDAGHRLLKFNAGGSNTLIVGHAGQPWHHDDFLVYPKDVAVDSAGNIWVVIPHAVKEFDASGNPVQRFPEENPWEEGDANDRFRDPQGIAFDSSGQLYVSDTQNHRIQVYDVSSSSPVYNTTIGVTGVPKSDNVGFNQPARIAFDSSDRLYVVDTANYRVQRCTFTTAWTCGTFFGVTGEPGNDMNHLEWALGMTIDSSDNIYIADGGNYRVLKCNTSGSCSHFAGTTGEQGWDNTHFLWPADVAVDSSGNVFVSDWDNRRIQKFNSGGSYVSTIGVTRVPYVPDTIRLNRPWGIAIAPDGSIYLTENQGYRLVKLNAAGLQQWKVGQAGVYGADNAQFGDWWAGLEGNVAVDAAGRVYVPDTSNNRVQIFNSNGTYFTTMGVTREAGNGNDRFDCPAGVAISPVNGDIFVVDRCNQRIQVFNSSRVYKATLGVVDETGSDNAHFNWPWGVAVDTGGNIYVADTDNQRVQKCNLSGSNYTCATFAGETGVFSSDFGHLHPLAVAVDGTGQVHVADEGNDRVQVFDSHGAYLTTIGGSWGANIGQLRGPSGIAVDSAGNVYVTDRDNHRIQKFAPGVPGWRQVNINGFGDRNNWAAWSLFTFNNTLYVSTGNYASGAEVYRLSSDDSWEQVVSGGFSDGTNVAGDSFSKFNGYLYAGTWNDNGSGGTNGGQIWRSPTGDNGSWERVVNNGFNDPINGEIMTLAPFNGYLYAGTWSYDTGVHGAEIWRSNTGNSGSWTQVVSDGNDDNNNYAILSFEVFNNYLYATTCNGYTGGEIWRTGDGTTWTQASPDGLNSANNVCVVSLEVFNGQLYAGTWNSTGGGEIWRTTNGINWNQAVRDGFDNANNIDVASLVVFDDNLYAIIGNFNTGSEVWRSSTGDKGSWDKVSDTGFGGGSVVTVDWDNITAVLNGNLYVGTFTWGNGGGKVWKTGKERVYLPIIIRGSSSGQQLGTPTLLNPSTGSTQARTTFDWTDVPGTIGYEFQLSTNSNFYSLAINRTVTDSQFVFTSHLAGTHYWRVRAIGPGGTSPYSAVRSIQLVLYNSDDDGDSLWNGWELHGYDANSDGAVDVNLPALGANYRHKDIFVEMDYMVRASATNGLGPNQAVLDSIEATFNNAPVSNPDGVGGITIHLELDDQVPYDDDLNPAYAEFMALKSAYFDLNRMAIYHYMIWGNKYWGGNSSGYSFGIPATDFIVTLGGWNAAAGGTDYEKIGTLIHELGHNLGLTHGGNDHINHKPNYISVMNYRFQTMGVYYNGSWYNFDYQRFGLPSLNEAGLNEFAGLTGGSLLAGYGTIHTCPDTTWWIDWDASGPIDWNCDGDTSDTGLAADINGDTYVTTLGSQNNWANVVFNGGGIIGSGLSPQVLAEQSKSTYVDPQLDELTYEQQLELDRLFKKALGP